MPQIAQQDYIRIEVSGESVTSGELTASEKAEIKKAVENGTILDVLLVNAAETLRIITVSPASTSIAVYSVEEEKIVVFTYNA